MIEVSWYTYRRSYRLMYFIDDGRRLTGSDAAGPVSGMTGTMTTNGETYFAIQQITYNKDIRQN